MAKIKLEITKAQLYAIMSITDDVSAMIGHGGDSSEWIKNVRLIDRALNNNGYKRMYN